MVKAIRMCLRTFIQYSRLSAMNCFKLYALAKLHAMLKFHVKPYASGFILSLALSHALLSFMLRAFPIANDLNQLDVPEYIYSQSFLFMQCFLQSQ